MIRRIRHRLASSRSLKAIRDCGIDAHVRCYPELKAFPPDQARRRLLAYEREEREKYHPWLPITSIVLVCTMSAQPIVIKYDRDVAPLFLFAAIALLALHYFEYRRIRSRAAAKVAAELSTGQLPAWLSCGYDLRATPNQCPECGTPTHSATLTPAP